MTGRQQVGWSILIGLVVGFFTLVAVVSGWLVAAQTFGTSLALLGLVGLIVLAVSLISGGRG